MDITIAKELDPSLLSLPQEDVPDSDDLVLMEDIEEEALGVEDVDLLADPACWRPSPSSSQILHKEGKTIGFRTKSGVAFGPDRIEIRPD